MLRGRSRRSRHHPLEQSREAAVPGSNESSDEPQEEKELIRETIRRVGEILEEFLIGNLESEFPVGGPSEESHGCGRTRSSSGGATLRTGGVGREVVEQQRDNLEEQQADEEARTRRMTMTRSIIST